MILDIFLISVIVSYCLDISGFWDEFSCPLCLTFWTGLVYIIVASFSLPLLLWVCVCSWMTTIYPVVFHFTESFIYKVFSELGEHFNLQ